METLSKHHKTLEFDKILVTLAEFCGCSETKSLALQITPARTFEEAEYLLAQTVEADTLSNKYGTPSIYGLAPCVPLFMRAELGASLSPKELLEVAASLKTARALEKWKKAAGSVGSVLDEFFSQLVTNKTLEEELFSDIISDDEIADTASPSLFDIRRKIRHSEQKARDVLDKIIKSSAYQKVLQDPVVTIRGGRFVVPVKSECRGEIKGLVHDTSASGATVFVEPMQVVEQNNLIRELEGKMQSEIARILLEFSRRIGALAGPLSGSYKAMLFLDLVFAKSRLAAQMKASIPILKKTGGTNLKKARHPLISPASVVPIDIMIGKEFDTLVITGPNTGGKTVALKTLGLLTLMASSGMMVPAADAGTVCFYTNVLADIGDEQSIEQSLSTFSSHMTNIVSILKEAGEKSLVLIDELGAGTDPVEGAALAIAIIQRLRELGAKIAATTHYAEMKLFALETLGVENASCEFDVATLSPTYRLLIGVPGRSNAFAISERLGLPADIIEKAKEGVSREDTRFEDIVSSFEENRLQLEREREEAARYFAEAQLAKNETEAEKAQFEKQKQALLQKAQDEARGLVEQAKYQSRQLLEELEALKRQKDKENFGSSVTGARTKYKSRLADLEKASDFLPKTEIDRNYRPPRPYKIGDAVKFLELGSEGVVTDTADQNGYLQVRAGILKTRVHESAIRFIQKEKSTFKGGSVSIKSTVSKAKEEASSSIMLRGMTVDEAIIELDRFIDTAVLSSMPMVTIIHGKGTGTLRKAVCRHLKSHKNIKNFRAGAYGEGESGVTIAELK